MSSGFEFPFATAFGVYFDFTLGVDFLFGFLADFYSAFRVGLGADGVANILSVYCRDIFS